ncbi:MAG TPA: peptide deformylase [Rhodobacteraceae bacterium]|nr:peptide deformylase [Paracoccaceae bacterium]
MTRPFLMAPDKRLRTVCPPVGAVDDHVRAVWDEMLAAMYAMPGVGLAGPQIGEMLRLAVVDCSDGRNEPVRMANPEVLHASAKLREHEEGSPNIPGLFAKVQRPRAITARYLDENGTVTERDFVGLWATSVQHQIDHLNGKLFVDHLSPVKRKMLLAKHAKNMKRRG